MKRTRRSAFWVLLLVFIVLPCWWVFHFPFRPASVCRLVPPQAIFASRHIAPAARITAIMGSTVVSNVAVALGADVDEVMASVQDAGIQKLVRILGRRYVATAIVPSMGVRGEKALLFGAWIGGYSQPLRWGLADRYFDGFSVHRLSGSRRVWFRACPEIRPGYSISLTVHEGVLLGCFSSEPLGVLNVLPRLERQLPVTQLVDAWVSGSTDGPDAFRFSGAPFSVAMPLRGALEMVSTSPLAMQLDVGPLNQIPSMARWASGATEDVFTVRHFDALLGKSPSMLVGTSVSQLAPLLVACHSPSQVVRLWAELEMLFQDESPACIFACGGDYYGRIKGMKVPSFGVALRLSQNISGDAAVRKLLDVLNARCGWGLVVTPDSQDSRIRVVDSVRSSGLKYLKSDDRLALALHNGWLMGMSNVAVLRRIMAETGVERMLPSTRDEKGGVAVGWADLSSSSDLFTKALAGYTLLSLVQGGRVPATRYDTAQLKAAIRVLGTLGELSFWLHPEGDASMLGVALSLSR